MKNKKLTKENLKVAFNDLIKTLIQTNNISVAIHEILIDCGTAKQLNEFTNFLNKHTVFMNDLTDILRENSNYCDN